MMITGNTNADYFPPNNQQKKYKQKVILNSDRTNQNESFNRREF